MRVRTRKILGRHELAETGPDVEHEARIRHMVKLCEDAIRARPVSFWKDHEVTFHIVAKRARNRPKGAVARNDNDEPILQRMIEDHARSGESNLTELARRNLDAGLTANQVVNASRRCAGKFKRRMQF